MQRSPTAQHPRPPRWPLLVIGAVVVALVAAAFAIAGLPLVPGPTSSASPMSSQDASASASGESEPAEADLPEPADFAWASAVWLPPAGAVAQPLGFSLQAGTLGDAAAVIDIEAPLVLRDVAEDAGRVAAFAGPAAGAVVYVADDGRASQIRRATLAEPGAEEVMAELEPIVWAIALERDASHAYLMLVHRAGGGDAGVVRLALDGSGKVTEILGPALPGGQAASTIRVAIVGFRAWLMLSTDDQHLLRRVCSDPAAPCALDAVDLGTAEVMRLPDAEAFGIAGGLVFWSRCLQAGCQIGATDIATSEEVVIAALNGLATVAELDGEPVVAYVTHTQDGQSLVAVVDPATGVSRELLRGAMFDLHSSTLDQSLKIAAPPGWIVIMDFGQAGEWPVAIRLFDGMTVPLPEVPRQMPLGIPQG